MGSRAPRSGRGISDGAAKSPWQRSDNREFRPQLRRLPETPSVLLIVLRLLKILDKGVRRDGFTLCYVRSS